MTDSTTAAMPRLLPCPFCGGPANIWRAHTYPFPRKAWIACMGDCGGKTRGTVLTTEYDTDAEATNAWNRRALFAVPPATWLEAMAQAITETLEADDREVDGVGALRIARAAYAALARKMGGDDAE